jgi:hypothetical protein
MMQTTALVLPSDLCLWCCLLLAGNCTYSAVQQMNAEHVHPVVSQIVQTAFFRYFKVSGMHHPGAEGLPASGVHAGALPSTTGHTTTTSGSTSSAARSAEYNQCD